MSCLQGWGSTMDLTNGLKIGVIKKKIIQESFKAAATAVLQIKRA